MLMELDRSGAGGLGGGGGGASSGSAPGIGGGSVGLGDTNGINNGSNGEGWTSSNSSGCGCPGGAAGENTGGGGGGGAGRGGGGAGGSGIVVVKYQVAINSYAEHNLTISTGSGAVDINGAVANIGTLSITSNSTSSEASGIISTDTIITKAGSGTLLLSANNTYTGQTNINAGIISITDNNSLGTQQMVQRLLQMALVYRSLMILPQQKTLPFQVLELVLMVQLETLQMTIH